MSQSDVLVWIVNQLVSLDITAKVDDGDLVFHPTSKLEPELRAAIRQHKPLLVTLLGMSVPPAQTTSMLPLRPHDYFDGIQRSERQVNAYDPANRRCGSCHFHDVDAFLALHHDTTDGDVGLCRRNPPVPRNIPYDWPTDKQMDEEGILLRSEFLIFGDWPETFETAWCGDWERAELAAYSCWFCRHPLLDHTIAPVTCRPSLMNERGGCEPGKHEWQHGPLRCWCYCEVPTPVGVQKGVAA
jgi:hypothetical protein